MTVPRVALHNLGCKVNQAETEAWSREFTGVGMTIVPHDDPADVVVINTCSVTNIADRKSRQALRAARRRNPNAIIVATGCYSSVEEDLATIVPEIDLVVTQSDKQVLVSRVVEECAARGLVADYDAGVPGKKVGRTRAFVKVADGCDRHCAFCIVPIARGRPHSRPVDDVVREVTQRVAGGYVEVVLTAVRLGTYGRDQQPVDSLPNLARTVLAATGVRRLRLSSVEPADLTDDFLDLWQRAEDRLCRHLHLALDSGCDATLARMRRRYTTEDYAAALARLRRAIPGIAITTDVIVGFPGESAGEFATSCEFVEAMGFAQVHVFQYSARKGTAAATMAAQVEPAERAARCERMLAIAEGSARRYRTALLGSVRPVLYEAPWEGATDAWVGLTDDYVRVVTRGQGSLRNTLVATRLVGLDGDVMTGELVDVPNAAP